MTTTPASEPFTVRAFLLGREGPDSGDVLVDPLHSGGTARALLGGARPLTAAADQAVERELASAVDSFLGQDLFDVAAGGWRKHAALTAAARRTRETPGSEEVLALASHQVTSSHRPYVDVFLDGAKVGTLDVELTLVFRISGLVAVVRDAHLVAVRSGECVLEGRLGVQQITLAERQGKLDLPGLWHLHAPIPLLRSRPAPPPPPPPAHPPSSPPPPPPPPTGAPDRRRHR
ncbi:hypothetical protein ACFV2N_14075 [Streptomyces sp. NPDC059680]|uniref:hypothetical protein n=1 Tax=Streptomyces TaxID=1883 RepID=UPI001E452E96|nr:hypothetical protein [Streptomyces barringtoniae]MCC5475930.1 hypothetical protein [Streptomyces barringtoniae]